MSAILPEPSATTPATAGSLRRLSRGDHLADRLRAPFFHHLALVVQDLTNQVRTHKQAPIGDGRGCRQELEGAAIRRNRWWPNGPLAPSRGVGGARARSPHLGNRCPDDCRSQRRSSSDTSFGDSLSTAIWAKTGLRSFRPLEGLLPWPLGRQQRTVMPPMRIWPDHQRHIRGH